MELNDRITQMLSPAFEAEGYEIVRVRLTGQKRMALQIMIDRADGQPISVDDCADCSHIASAILDVEDPIKAAYALEVTSPGIDRPLVRVKDFQAYIGFQIKLSLTRPVEGRKRYRGQLNALLDNDSAIAVTDEEGHDWQFPLAQIDEAKLVLDDKLLAASRQKAADLGLTEGFEGGLVDEGE